MTGTDDPELDAFTRGDLEAFETLFRRYQGEVYGWIVRIVRDPGAAEDLTLETFWRIYRARGRFDPRRPFGAWTRRIATNLAIEHLGRRGGEQPLDARVLARAAAPAAADAALAAEVGAQVAAAFGELPPTLRAAAALALIEETPYAEMAGALGISVNGVKSRVFRAVRLLRKGLEKRGVRP
jgi:RNA polymerase sigma factor (sigma-70 family)